MPAGQTSHLVALILGYMILTLVRSLHVSHITDVFRREPWFFTVVMAVVLTYGASIYWISAER